MKNKIDDFKLLSAIRNDDISFVVDNMDKIIINKKLKSGRQPLSEAVVDNSIRLARFFIANGADVNAKGRKGYSPLHWAVESLRVDLASFLIKNGAEINQVDDFGNTPLWYACYNWRKEGGKEMIILLLDNGADPIVKNKFDKRPIDWAEHDPDLNAVFNDIQR